MNNLIVTEQSELMDNDIVFTNLMESVGLSTEIITEAFDIKGFISRVKELFKKLLEQIRNFFTKKKINMASAYQSLNKIYRDNYDIIKKNYETDWSIQGYTYNNFDNIVGNIYNVFENKSNMLTVQIIEDNIRSGKYARNTDDNINSYNSILLDAVSKAIESDGTHNNISEMIQTLYVNARYSESPIKISKRNIYIEDIEAIISDSYKPRVILDKLSKDIQGQIQQDLKYIEYLERTLEDNEDNIESKRAYMQVGIKCISFQKSLVSRIIEAVSNICAEELNQTKKIIELLIHLKNNNAEAKNEMGMFAECSFM